MEKSSQEEKNVLDHEKDIKYSTLAVWPAITPGCHLGFDYQELMASVSGARFCTAVEPPQS